MNGQTLPALLPMIALAVTALAVTLLIAVRRHHRSAILVTIGGLAVALASLVPATGAARQAVTPLLVVDRFALLYTGLLITATVAVAVISYGALERYRDPHREEFYVLLLLGTLGGAVLASSNHFASVFLGLETLTVSLYVLIGYRQRERRPVEAAVKYLILAAVSSAFLLFGMAIVYDAVGTMEFTRMSTAAPRVLETPITIAGVGLMSVGIGFKLALVPFHMWTADVYDGAPTPVTAFLATVSKGAVFALLLRFLTQFDGYRATAIVGVFTVMAALSMLIGNLLALHQRNIKRLLAYSSIAHLGYLLVALLAGGEIGATAASFYLAAYFATTLAAFGVVTVLSDGTEESHDLDAYRGLYWDRPALAVVLTVALLSLAGIPLTAGFLAKFYVLAAGVSTALWVLVMLLVGSSVIGLFYYLRVIVTMLDAREGLEIHRTPPSSHLWPTHVALGVFLILIVWLGTYPAPLVQVLEASTDFMVP